MLDVLKKLPTDDKIQIAYQLRLYFELGDWDKTIPDDIFQLLTPVRHSLEDAKIPQDQIFDVSRLYNWVYEDFENKEVDTYITKAADDAFRDFREINFTHENLPNLVKNKSSDSRERNLSERLKAIRKPGSTKIPSRNRIYEVMYIAQPEITDEDITKLNDSITQIVEKEGSAVKIIEGWGRRRLAHPINKRTEGFYVLLEIEGSGQEVAELERRFRVNDVILRYMTVRVDEDRKEAKRKHGKRSKRSKKNFSIKKEIELSNKSKDD